MKNLTAAQVLERVRAGLSLAGAQLINLDLSGADLRNADLARATLLDCDLEGADLSGVILQEARLSNCRLARARLFETNLAGAVLAACDGTGLTCAQSVLYKTTFESGRLRGATFTDTQFGDRVILIEAEIGRAHV